MIENPLIFLSEILARSSTQKQVKCFTDCNVHGSAISQIWTRCTSPATSSNTTQTLHQLGYDIKTFYIAKTNHSIAPNHKQKHQRVLEM